MWGDGYTTLRMPNEREVQGVGTVQRPPRLLVPAVVKGRSDPGSGLEGTLA